MRLELLNLFTESVQQMDGSPKDIEQQLRKHFGAQLAHIPLGDLPSILWAINRMHGYSCVISDALGFVPHPPAYNKRPTTDDPWVREVETETDPALIK